MNNMELTNPDHFSTGCKCCQSGKWLCLFLTYKCQANCSFCPAPFHDDRTFTEFGPSLEHVLDGMATSDFRGVAFSGGDCFLVPERLLQWQKAIHRSNSDLYYWVYTNGLSAYPDMMEKLVQNGMNEIRFNLAATGYKNRIVWEHLKQAVELYDRVAVEIPSIPAHFETLCSVLPQLYDAGVSYLNLHEYILPDDDANAPETEFNITNTLKYDPASLENTAKIVEFCRQHQLGLIINNCSIMQKEQQMLHRRLFWANRVKKSWERVTSAGLLETLCRKEFHTTLLHEQIDHIPTSAFRFPETEQIDGQYLRILFTPPLNIRGKRRLVSIQEKSN